VAPGQYGSASLLIVADDPAAGSINRWTIGQAWERNPYSRDEQRQPSRAVAESNARVMAAALDALAACELVLQAFAYSPGMGPAYYEAARRAVSKALP
jgi:hypothetical protein